MTGRAGLPPAVVHRIPLSFKDLPTALQQKILAFLGFFRKAMQVYEDSVPRPLGAKVTS